MARIPKIFHFVFGLKPQTEPFHLAYYLCLRSCIEVNKPNSIYFHCYHIPYGAWWDSIKPFLIIKEINKENFLNTYQYQNKDLEKYRYAHISDILRLEVLIEYGGIYADIDTLFVNKIPECFHDQAFILGNEKVDIKQDAGKSIGGSLCNAWIASEKDSEFAKIWLEKINTTFDGTWSAHSTFLPYTLSQKYSSLIHIEPEHSFFYFDWTKEGIANIFTKKIVKVEGVYSIHLWSHLWWDKKRTDFSYFNNERLNVRYVKYADTTYATLARSYLPKKSDINRIKYLKERITYFFQDVPFLIRKFFKKKMVDIYKLTSVGKKIAIKKYFV